MNPAFATHSRPMLALAIRLATAASLATMAALIKMASERGIHLMEIVFWRQAVTVPLALAWVMATGRLGDLAAKRPRTHALRAITGMTGMILNFAAVILLPLAEATSLAFTTPIFAVILSVILLKEKVGPYRWIAVILGFSGVLVITQPGGGHLPILGASIALAAAFMVALISIQVADLNRTDKPLTIVFWFALSTTGIAAFALPFVMVPHSGFEWLLLISIGLVGGMGQLLLTASLRFGSVASVIVMDYSALIWATLFGWLIWDHLPPGSTWLGAPLIIIAGLIITWREHSLSRRAKSALE